MFGRLDTYNIPTLNSFADAQRRWDNTAPLRGDRDKSRRPLAARSSRTAQWLIHYGDRIAVRYWRTDLVVYQRDGAVDVHPWSSKTSREFENAVLPHALKVRGSPHGELLRVQVGYDTGRFYRCDNWLRLRPAEVGWTVDESAVKPRPFRSLRFNTKRAKAALAATRWADFSAWALAADAMGLQHASMYDCHLQHRGRRILTELLANQEQWGDLYKFAAPSTELLLERVRDAVYTIAGDVIDVEEIPYVTSWPEVQALAARERKYDHLT